MSSSDPPIMASAKRAPGQHPSCGLRRLSQQDSRTVAPSTPGSMASSQEG